MARYTVELREIINSSNDIFDLPYEFYDPDVKGLFEQKFIEHYYFHEIGFETVDRFKMRLRSRLNMIMPKYCQLYNIELKTQDLNFLFNKDYKETYIRELTGEQAATVKSTTTANGTSDNKVSSVDNGNASVSLDPKNLTYIDHGTTDGINTSDITNDGTNKQTEKYETIGQGNIGTTTSADLVSSWRDILINLDELIIDECKDLFMGVF